MLYLKNAGKTAAYLPDADAIVNHVCKNIQGGDILCVFSNGGFGGIHGKLLDRLSQRNNSKITLRLPSSASVLIKVGLSLPGSPIIHPAPHDARRTH